jgi:hypothetical protein
MESGIVIDLSGSGQTPPQDTLKRMSELKDEDIVYDDDCPMLTPKMEKALACAVAQRNRLQRK